MIADLGTQKGAKLADVEPKSDWIMGQRCEDVQMISP